MLIIGAFLLGLVVGSFLNVLIIRGYREEKPNGRSRCMRCGKILKVRELIPVLSFLAQKGRCRSCGIVLSWQYPLVELATAVLFAFSTWYALETSKYLNIEAFVVILASWVIISAAIHIFVTDLRWQIIPNGAVLVLLIVAVILLETRSATIVVDLVSSLIIALFLTALWFFSKGRAIGFGDVKLIFATSLLLGFPSSVVAFLFSFWLGGLIGILLLATRQKKLKNRIPFGPFILVGTALAYFFTPAFLEYTNLVTLF